MIIISVLDMEQLMEDQTSNYTDPETSGLLKKGDQSQFLVLS